MHLQCIPFPYLTTERLQLRPLALSDDQEILFHRSDPRMLQYIDIERSHNLEDARRFIQKIEHFVAENKSVYWAICLKNNPMLIGTICMWNLDEENASADIGYGLHPDFQGKGYMQEALEKVMEFGFSVVQAQTLIGVVHPENAPSIRLLEKNGFVRTGEEDGLFVFIRSEK